MLTLSQSLSYYRRSDVRKLILKHAQDKEIGVRFNEDFGKRPDTINYDTDVLEFAKKGVTSFHCSEELWNNPLQLNPNLKRNDLDELRKGWDLILDIDCPYWDFSKLTTYLFIKALKDHKIDSVTVKFSGSKGFHIAVPFEAFPTKKYYIDGQHKDVKSLFPEGPRKIAAYLVHYINNELIKVEDTKIFFGKFPVNIEKIYRDTGKSEKELIISRCVSCKKIIDDKKELVEYICPNCENSLKDTDKDFVQCPKCKKIMGKNIVKKSLCECGSNKSYSEFDLSSIVAVDTILISSRHLYRMPYSLHEKTGFVSVPFDVKHILKFDKSEADTKNFKEYTYLDREEAKAGEAELLFQKSFEFESVSEKKYKEKVSRKITMEKSSRENTESTIPIPEECFPPCIKKISAGLEDGKKRALFILINFLGTCNWTHEMMEEYLIKWNQRNTEPLRETYLRGQLRYFKQQKEKAPPPNCDNKGYMIDTGFCNPDGLCKKIKNPAQYSKRKMFLSRK